MFGFGVSFDTQYLLFVSRYRLIFDIFYVTFQGYRFGVFIVIVYKAPVCLTSVFKTCYSPDLERADFDRQSAQYTWLNGYFFSSLQESSPNILSYKELLASCNILYGDKINRSRQRSRTHNLPDDDNPHIFNYLNIN